MAPVEAKWDVGPGGVEPAPAVSCSERVPDAAMQRWTEGPPTASPGDVLGELGAAVGIAGDPVSADGYVTALSVLWGPSAVDGATHAAGVFEVTDGLARLLTRHPFTAETESGGHQRVVLSTPLCVRAGQFLGVLNLEDDYCCIAYFRPSRSDTRSDRDDEDQPPAPALYGVDCTTAWGFLRGDSVRVVPAVATLRLQWELQSALAGGDTSAQGEKGSEPRVCWTVGPDDIHRSTGQLGAAVGICTPAVSEAGE